MKIAMIADTHIHPFTSFGVGTGSGNSRVQTSLDALDQVLNYCKSKGITTLVHAGDLFHARDHQRFQVFNAVRDKLMEMSQYLTIHLIAGNHDIVDRQGTLSIHSLQSDNYHGIRVYGSAASISSGPEIILIPYENNFEDLNHLLWELPKSNCIIGHLDVHGAEIGSTMFPSDKGLDRKVLEKFKAVLLGHYHRHQHLGGNAYYVGALTPIDFGDKDQGGEFCILDTETGQISRIPIQCPKFIDGLGTERNRDFSSITGNYVRVHCEHTPEWDDIMSVARPAGVEYIPLTEEPVGESRIVDIDQLNIPEMIKQYVEVRKPSGLDTEELLAVGNELFSG